MERDKQRELIDDMLRWNSKFNRIAVIVLAVTVVGLALGSRYVAVVPNAMAGRCIRQRQLEDALAWLEWTRKVSPEDARAEFLRARISRRKGQMDRVREHLQQAAKYGYAVEALQREEWLALAQSGQMREAQAHFGQLLTDPRGEGAEISEAYVIGYLKRRSFDEAAQLLAAWSADFPKDPQPHFYQGLISQDRDVWREAIGHFEHALQADPKHTAAALATAKCYLELKQPGQALEYYKLAAQGDEQLCDALVGQSHCLRELGRSKEAREPLTRALAEEPENPAAILELAEVELEAGEYEPARQRLEPLVELAPNNHDARFAYATALRGSGKTDEARQQFEAVALARGELAKAKNLAQQIKSDDDVDSRAQIGAIYLEYGDPDEGLHWLFGVLDEAPGHKAAHRALAAYYALKKDEDPRFAVLAKRHHDLGREE